MSQPAKKYDESLINFYDENLVTHADTAYRFAYALTLSLDGAMRCVQRTFQHLAMNLEKVQAAGESNIPSLLVSECWRAYQDLKGQKFPEGLSSVSKVFKPMSVENRAAITAVDAIGLSPGEAARALGWQENDLRVQLAQARRTLMMSTLEM